MAKRKAQADPSDDEVSTFDPADSIEDPEYEEPTKKTTRKKKTKSTTTTKTTTTNNGGKDEEVNDDDIPKERPPNVNSDILPLPWKGRLGYACLNTYLRTASPPIFCSRTCRIETILKQGGPYLNTDGTPGPGLQYVQKLGLDNARDLIKLIQWNERYNIRFLRISSEMFPFASHAKYGYDLEFAKPVLAEAGRLAMKLGHRLTTHPGQFTQIASPRKPVIEASLKDLEYHVQLLQGLGMEGQSDRDAVMILHMGGVFGDREATLERFKDNYRNRLTKGMKDRLVLENDDVSWSVHDLLPVCEDLNIPLVLDYHHHNIIHDSSLRAGTLDLLPLLPRIRATWTRKNITQKQHYSEPCPGAVTDRQMRKHSPRVWNLPPCEQDMDLMIEAKDKEQAVFELYRKYNIFTDFAEVIPHERDDENREVKPRGKKQIAEEEERKKTRVLVEEDNIGMGGPGRRVFWPEGKEEWLSPAKKLRKNKQKEEVDEAIEDAEEEHTMNPEDDTKATKGKKKTNGSTATTSVRKTTTSSSSTRKTKSIAGDQAESQLQQENADAEPQRPKKTTTMKKKAQTMTSSKPGMKMTNKQSVTEEKTVVENGRPKRKAAMKKAIVDDDGEESELSELERTPPRPMVEDHGMRGGKRRVVAVAG